MRRIRLPKKDIMRWLSENYGAGGFENYDGEQVRDVLSALRLIMENAGHIELEFLVKFLVALSDNPGAYSQFFSALRKYGV